jgi:hypothetical protein
MPKVFVPPANREEAEERWREKAAELKKLEGELQNESEISGKSGTSHSEFLSWRNGVVNAKREARRQLSHLEIWMKQEALRSPHVQLNEKRLQKLLQEAYKALLSCQRRGVVLTNDEEGVLKQIQSELGLDRKPTDEPLNFARACCVQGTPEDVAEMGRSILSITHDPEDLRILSANWKRAKSLKNSSSTRAQAGLALIRGCIVLGQTTEAVQIATAIDGTEAEGVAAWLSISESSQEAQNCVAKARKNCALLKDTNQVAGWCKIFEKTGEQQDIQKALQLLNKLMRTDAAQRLDGLHLRVFSAYLIRKMITEARQVLKNILQSNERLRALGSLVQETKLSSDLQELLQLVNPAVISRPMSLILILQACAVCNRYDMVKQITEALTDRALQCVAYSWLAALSDIDQEQRLATLKKAEDLAIWIVAANVGAPTALKELTKAYIASGRDADALRTAKLIVPLRVRCEALLAIHQWRRQNNIT